jgi:hypothetical protein
MANQNKGESKKENVRTHTMPNHACVLCLMQKSTAEERVTRLVHSRFDRSRLAVPTCRAYNRLF